jgi:serine/threonine protein phosphatase 1
MLNLFWAPSNPPRTARPCIPEGLRIYAVADIHGRVDLLETLLSTIAEDCRRAPQAVRIIFLGDYVDRGPFSCHVLDLLTGPSLPRDGAVFLKGNHEDALLAFLDDPMSGPPWFALGGMATLSSYDVRVPCNLPSHERLDRLRDQFQRALPPDHLRFLRSLRLAETVGDYFFVHAGVDPRVPLDDQAVSDMLTIRDRFLDWERPLDKVIVHGHSVSSEPVFKSWHIGIDTAAFATGRLACLALEGTDRWILST